MGTLIQRALREQSNGDVVIQVIRDRSDPMLRHYLKQIMKLFQDLDYEMSDFHQRAFNTPGESYQFSENELYDELDQGNILLVVHDLSGVLGLAQVYFDREEKKPTEMTLRYLVVGEEHRGRGLGTHLLNKVLALAEEAKVPNLTLGVYAANKGALKLYSKFGFTTYHLSMVRRIK